MILSGCDAMWLPVYTLIVYLLHPGFALLLLLNLSATLIFSKFILVIFHFRPIKLPKLKHKSDKSVEIRQVICAYEACANLIGFPSSVLISQVNDGLMRNAFERIMKKTFQAVSNTCLLAICPILCFSAVITNKMFFVR